MCGISRRLRGYESGNQAGGGTGLLNDWLKRFDVVVWGGEAEGYTSIFRMNDGVDIIQPGASVSSPSFSPADCLDKHVVIIRISASAMTSSFIRLKEDRPVIVDRFVASESEEQGSLDRDELLEQMREKIDALVIMAQKAKPGCKKAPLLRLKMEGVRTQVQEIKEVLAQEFSDRVANAKDMVCYSSSRLASNGCQMSLGPPHLFIDRLINKADFSVVDTAISLEVGKRVKASARGRLEDDTFRLLETSLWEYKIDELLVSGNSYVLDDYLTGLKAHFTREIRLTMQELRRESWLCRLVARPDWNHPVRLEELEQGLMNHQTISNCIALGAQKTSLKAGRSLSLSQLEERDEFFGGRAGAEERERDEGVLRSEGNEWEEEFGSRGGYQPMEWGKSKRAESLCLSDIDLDLYEYKTLKVSKEARRSSKGGDNLESQES